MAGIEYFYLKKNLMKEINHKTLSQNTIDKPAYRKN